MVPVRGIFNGMGFPNVIGGKGRQSMGMRSAADGGLLRAPVNLTWEITRRCNLSCRHCLSMETMAHCGPELDLDGCRGLIDELDRIKVFQVNFGGGEPFLRDDFLDVLRYAHARRIVTCVSTNGTVLTEDLARELSGMELLYLQVSLDGATAPTNDAIRGRGTFDRIVEGIGRLVAQGFRRLSTNTVVTSVNLEEVPLMYEFGKRHGVRTRLSRFRPSGNAKKSWGEYHLDQPQLARLSAFLHSHPDVLTGDSFFSIASAERRGLGLGMCGAARMTCAVAPDGTVYPCAFLQEPTFRAGNVVQERLGSIWQTAPVFRGLRNIRVASCEACGEFEHCHGGCPAVAYFLTSSLDRADPECMRQFEEKRPASAGERG